MAARIQLCGSFVVELSPGVTTEFPSRQTRVLFAYLVLSRPHPVTRDALVDALWGDTSPASAGAALSVLISKLRTTVGSDLIRGRTEVAIALPDDTRVDVETAFAALHTAESAIATGEWQRAWFSALTAQFNARRTLLPEVELAWVDSWRRRLADVRVRALEAYASACLQLGGPELPGAERASRELLEVAPMRETGHLMLMRSLAAAGNTAEALAVYERLRRHLREELGVNPSRDLQDAYQALLI
ncbi:BTAD domain-containing putative transcriptional regulator [Kribbella sp. NPDC050281]|uniref:AfsR/SARP family transcriptional regulator n=1 Tax=Kribbella sp. NPDC050281 TaxID=3155515 RepID=UPI0033D50629